MQILKQSSLQKLATIKVTFTNEYLQASFFRMRRITVRNLKFKEWPNSQTKVSLLNFWFGKKKKKDLCLEIVMLLPAFHEYTTFYR